VDDLALMNIIKRQTDLNEPMEDFLLGKFLTLLLFPLDVVSNITN